MTSVGLVPYKELEITTGEQRYEIVNGDWLKLNINLTVAEERADPAEEPEKEGHTGLGEDPVKYHIRINTVQWQSSREQAVLCHYLRHRCLVRQRKSRGA